MNEKIENLIGVIVAIGVLLMFQIFLDPQQAEQKRFVVGLDDSRSEVTSETKANEKWVQIPEGLRKEQIAEKVREKLGWSSSEKEDFLKKAEEGRLFPDTYLLQTNYSGKEVAKRMNNRFHEKVSDLFEEAKKQNIRNDTLIVLASIVQREAADEEQMPLIAGIIWNRWLNDRPFEVDATLQYALGNSEDWWPKIKPEHQEIDSPYNTYANKGRPPAPICNPGLAAIRAVIFSEETDYFYYLHDPQGKIHLAETEPQHWQNIDRYLRFPWVYQQEKLHELSTTEVDSVLKKLKEKFSDSDQRLEALSLLRLGTPYERGCLGEESARDEDPIFRLDVTDCTAFVLTNAALLYSESLEEARKNMEKTNYRSGEISFEDRLHFSTDRNEVSSYFEPATSQIVEESKVENQQVTLNKKRDGERLLDIDWQKETTVKYVPRQYIKEELLSAFPQSLGVAFVNEEMFNLGLDVVHEGFLFDQRYLVHASSEQGEVVKVNFLDYFQSSNFDGIVLYKVD